MESIVTVIIVVALILTAGLNIFQTSLDTQEQLMNSWQEMEERTDDRVRTDLTPISATVQNNGGLVQLTLKNNGRTSLTNFDEWDIFMQYYSSGDVYHTDWYPYTSGAPGGNQWTATIYTDAAGGIPELYEPGILNPDEELLLQLNIAPGIALTTTNRLTLSANNGITASTIITR
ncbi:MAG: hypothetical protein KC433_27390 [Anaerolineales bacterium]|nr:hypothetical protein [Anaerolineales bacterium]MCB8940109.1 hypothetical protein [Ardenticatenaceae bacterium]